MGCFHDASEGGPSRAGRPVQPGTPEPAGRRHISAVPTRSTPRARKKAPRAPPLISGKRPHRLPLHVVQLSVTPTFPSVFGCGNVVSPVPLAPSLEDAAVIVVPVLRRQRRNVTSPRKYPLRTLKMNKHVELLVSKHDRQATGDIPDIIHSNPTPVSP